MARRINRGYRKLSASQYIDRKYGMTDRVRKILSQEAKEEEEKQTIKPMDNEKLAHREHIRTLARSLSN